MDSPFSFLSLLRSSVFAFPYTPRLLFRICIAMECMQSITTTRIKGREPLRHIIYIHGASRCITIMFITYIFSHHIGLRHAGNGTTGRDKE